MASADLAIARTLEREGSTYTDHPADRGGPTRWGITLATLERVKPGATAADVRALTREDAVGIYRRLYWPEAYTAIVDQAVAGKLYDAGVNSGPRWAVRMAQQAATRLGHLCAADGAFGPATLAAVNACEPKALLLEMARAMAAHYRAIVAADPTQEVFLAGWLKRAASGVA